ncbi:MAG: hypothetical protein IKE38_02925 [Erysipelotrichaceae bacterium]|nr:hypothetical protein [Erysipelotrichaceae bacterium]
MKRIIRFLFVIALIIPLSACDWKHDNYTGMSNPTEGYGSLSEINNAIGVSLVKLPVANISEEAYYLIDDKIAEYDFIANGIPYYFRASRMLDEDISGIYIDGEPAFSDLDETFSINQDDKHYKTCRFTVKDVQYCLTVKDDGSMEYSVFSDLAAQAREYIATNAYNEEINSLAGSYYDSFSSRAHAIVTVVDGRIAIDIMWSNSVKEYEEWIMFVKYEGDKLTYDEVLHTTVTSSKGKETVTPASDYGPGYFEIIDSDLYWTGSGDELTSQCIFEKSE